MSGVIPPDDRPGAEFVSFTRAEWAARYAAGPDAVPDPGGERRELTGAVAGRGDSADPIPADELAEVYRPLVRFLAGLAEERPRTPYLVGVTGGVAAGKTTLAGRLAAVLDGQAGLGSTEILSTDSFLFPNTTLAARGLMARKGFPETYDVARLTATVTALRDGAAAVEVPVYSHHDYDIVPGRHRTITRPSVLIVEGLGVLRAGPGDGPTGLPLDWSIYLDADEADLVRWHCRRLLDIHRTGSVDAPGFLGWFCTLSEDEARTVAEQSWWGINSVNLREHIAPTRARASMVLHKGADHRVTQIRVRVRSR